MKSKRNLIKCKKKNERLKNINQICILNNNDFIYFNGGFLYYCDFKSLNRKFGKELFISIHNIFLIDELKILCSHSRNQFSIISIDYDKKEFIIHKTFIVENLLPIETFYSIEIQNKNILSYSTNKLKFFDISNSQNINSIIFPFEIMNIYEIKITNELIITYENSKINFLNMNLLVLLSHPIEINYLYKNFQNICQLTNDIVCIGYNKGFILINIFNHLIIKKINVSDLNITNIIKLSEDIFIIRNEPQHKLIPSLILFYKINKVNNECFQIHKDLIDSEIKNINYLSSNILLIISTEALKVIEFELKI